MYPAGQVSCWHGSHETSRKPQAITVQAVTTTSTRPQSCLTPSACPALTENLVQRAGLVLLLKDEVWIQVCLQVFSRGEGWMMGGMHGFSHVQRVRKAGRLVPQPQPSKSLAPHPPARAAALAVPCRAPIQAPASEAPRRRSCRHSCASMRTRKPDQLTCRSVGSVSVPSCCIPYQQYGSSSLRAQREGQTIHHPCLSQSTPPPASLVR